ncbi:SCO-spondin-like [Mercenaria mercenaria]|uniref:SCO-spondin-like n=1 Tax=Mercenaria mercenaria TaxID=6596 RepID=UPI00234E41C4|nr:SCO-spondin-like [Mercenaria mercenaria]
MNLIVSNVYVKVLILIFCTQDLNGSRVKRYLLDSSPLPQNVYTGPYQWTLWTAWSNCDGNCLINGGIGNRIRERFCDDGDDFVKIHHCQDPYTGDSDDTIIVKRYKRSEDGHEDKHTDFEFQTCQLNCTHNVNVWDKWQAWTTCSVSCGDGTRSRSRQCSTGSDCTGLSIDIATCTEQLCSINGGWSGWTEFGECSRSCGNGVTFRTRQCNYPVPQNGGLDCTGNTQEVKVCKKSDCPIDGGWSGWSEFGKCSRSCGNGVTFRTRQCNYPVPQNGGHNCSGSSQEPKACQKSACPIDGGWSVWSEFGECSRSCGIGVTFRTRQCNYPIPQNGGRNCSGSSQEFKSCQKSACPIDGGWSNFTNLTCSATCGTGVMTSFRTCSNPKPEYGGKNCTGVSHTFSRCHVRDCVVNAWSLWSVWSDCSVTCASGTKSRTRTCLSAVGCIGDSHEKDTCSKNPCLQWLHIVDGHWSEWLEWTSCNASCGNGTQSRTRLCNSPAPQNGGQNCKGTNRETQTCFSKQCPIDGGWSVYTTYTCSVTCGRGQQISLRDCNNPSPQFGGKDCEGLSHKITECNLTPCAIDGSWGVWSNWTSCSTSCGSGRQTRARLCDSPSPQYGGYNCSGNNTQTQLCHNPECPVDGGWSDYLNISCSVTCGHGQLVSIRTCTNPSPQFGGRVCQGLSHRLTECNMPACAIDGNWSNWSQFTSCGSVCGDGYTWRYRTCSNPAPQNGGKNCTGSSEQRLACNNGPCPAVPVLFIVSGADASRIKRFFINDLSVAPTVDTGPYHWSQWSLWTSCNGTCNDNGGLGKQSRSRWCSDDDDVVKLRHCRNPYQSDDTPVSQGKILERTDVVLEDGTSSSHSAQHYREYEYQSCVAQNCPVNGGWSSWGNYSSCSVSSGNGHMTRYRLCNNPTPVYGGHDCIGLSSESKQCTVNLWSNWGSWIPCSVSCGTGIRLRSRHCSTGSDCVGATTDAETCMETSCSVDGGWGAWTEFGACSRSCGNGVAFRTRQCNFPVPQNGGLNCTGSSQDFKACIQGTCTIDGGWTSYQDMPCSVTCGLGVLTSFRTCTNPVPEYGGKNCTGEAYTFKRCKLQDCLDGSWSQWSNWSDCSSTCGNGTQIRTRLCNNPGPQNGGLDCPGLSIESMTCNVKHCPIDGGWSEFQNLSCSATCGKGAVLSYRACNNPTPQYGGKDCVGLVHQIHECSLTPCKLDGSWGSWSNWTECGSSCGNGTQTKKRQCDSPAPQYGGQNCSGKDIETQPCFVTECPIDGGWSDFRNVSCSVTCGRGQEIAIRDCNNPAPQFGGKDCVGLSHHITECAMPSCAVDGNWSEWYLAGQCGSMCGDGYTIRYRTCSNPAPENGGQNCTGNHEERLACNNGPCPADVPICDKSAVTDTLKIHTLFAPTRAGPCSNMDYIPEENMLKNLCGAPSDTNVWGVSKDVRTNCENIPLYSPIAKVHREYKTRNYGILLDCYQSQLKFATETCEDGVHEVDIRLDVADEWDYFTMTW